MFKGTAAVFHRELAAYFATPLALVFIVIFLFAMGAFTFYLGGFYDSGQANLAIFFSFHPYLYLFLIPAIAMRLWAEERKSGTLELLLTLPIPPGAAVLGKFLAAWAFAGIALALTFPMWMTVNFLGRPDNGVILASYAGSWLMAGGYLAIGSAVSAATRSQVIAFIVSVVICFLFLLAGFAPILDTVRGWASPTLVEAIANMSFLANFSWMAKGVVPLSNVLFFISLIAAFVTATGIILDMKKAE